MNGKINKKTIISAASIIIAIFTILGGMWAFDSHYAKSAEIEELEVQVVQSLRQYNEQQIHVQQIYQYKNEYRFYQFIYDKLGRDLLEIRRQIRRYPEDEILRQDYVEVREERVKIKEKMDEILRKIE